MRHYLPAFVFSLAALGCAWEQPSGRIEGGSVRIICGQPGRPCNFHVVAPQELTRACVSLDGVQIVPLFPSHIEHPYRTLLLSFIGIQPSSQAVVATFHLPAGTHVVRISQSGWLPIERTVVGTGLSDRIELVIRLEELRKESAQ
jgi:hypothetical protein